MYALHADLREFLLHPSERLQHLRHWKREDESIIYDYEGRNVSLVGLLDNGDRLTKGSSGIDDLSLARLNTRVFEKLPVQTGKQKRYNDYWFNRLFEAYQGSATRLVFFRVPTDAIARRIAIPTGTSALDQLSTHSNVSVLPQNLFHKFEAPEYFADDLHMNSSARAQFTDLLSKSSISALKCPSCEQWKSSRATQAN